MLRAIRGHFEATGCLEVQTPVCVPSPGLDLHIDAPAVLERSRDLASARHGDASWRWLQTSPEYAMKRLLAGGLGDIFQLVPCFRAGEVGRLHEPEFTMLEWYRVGWTADALMGETEALVRASAQAVCDDPETIAWVDWASIAVDAERPFERISLAAPFERLPLSEAFARHAARTLEETLELGGPDAVDEALAFEVGAHLGRTSPTFVTHWPAEMAALARLHPADPRVAERFELYVAGVELCNGFRELTDPAEQRRRCEVALRDRQALGKAPHPLDERFLAALEEGLPESAGNALGVDRLLMVLIGARTLADVMAMPRIRAR